MPENDDFFSEVSIGTSLTRKLSKEKALSRHHEMWEWIANESEKRGRVVDSVDYACEILGCTDVEDFSWCCEHARDCMVWLYHVGLLNEQDCTYDGICRYCPIDWQSHASQYQSFHSKCDGDNKGLLYQWIFAKSLRQSIKLAKRISELPVKP